MLLIWWWFHMVERELDFCYWLFLQHSLDWAPQQYPTLSPRVGLKAAELIRSSLFLVSSLTVGFIKVVTHIIMKCPRFPRLVAFCCLLWLWFLFCFPCFLYDFFYGGESSHVLCTLTSTKTLMRKVDDNATLFYIYIYEIDIWIFRLLEMGS